MKLNKLVKAALVTTLITFSTAVFAGTYPFEGEWKINGKGISTGEVVRDDRPIPFGILTQSGYHTYYPDAWVDISANDDTQTLRVHSNGYYGGGDMQFGPFDFKIEAGKLFYDGKVVGAITKTAFHFVVPVGTPKHPGKLKFEAAYSDLGLLVSHTHYWKSVPSDNRFHEQFSDFLVRR